MLFISHSSKDSEFVQCLIDLLRSALPISPDDIRCTSVDGYTLPAGTAVEEQLRLEVHDSEAFIGVISYHSLQSLYVVFELGGRWAADKQLIPILAPGIPISIVRSPLSSLQFVRSQNPAQLHQLVAQLAKTLKLSVHAAAVYQREIDSILALPSAEGEVVVPDYLLSQLKLPFPARKETLPESQKELLNFLETESQRRGSVPQQDLEAVFREKVKSVYWRLEALCYLGFVSKEITNFRSSTPTYNYKLSEEYRRALSGKR